MVLHAATSNPGKLAEFAASAAAFGSAAASGVEVLALPGLAAMPEPVEDATTFQGNADLKAIAYSNLSPGLLVLCDDSGIALDALHGAPGVRSARFADDLTFEPELGTKDDRNNALLLHLMAHHTNRAAHFLCALALARDGQILLRAEGSVHGELLHQPRGTAGFGYDPLFLIPALNLTMAELTRAQKWQLSHRGNAFRSLLAQLGNHPL